MDHARRCEEGESPITGGEANLNVAAQTVSGKPSGSKALESFCRDLCQQARDKSIDVVSGFILTLPVPACC